ncbi:MotA/TolQ/ExbB proton channel family protein [Myxococcota bacterium]|nr:MotA/TolQ/ExbB proton channel family protein [Myxococcota bacterium]
MSEWMTMGRILWARTWNMFGDGGLVMWPLLGVGIALWYLLASRYFKLQMASKEVIHCGTDESPFHCNLILRRLRNQRLSLSRHGAFINTLVAAAPLLGLLGTVSGMISTFDSLESMTLYTQNGGIAGGISEALTTTQMGLAISLPGVLASRLLANKATRIGRVIEERMDDLESALGVAG